MSFDCELELVFKVNGDTYNLQVPEEDLYRKLTDDNEYVRRYLTELLEVEITEIIRLEGEEEVLIHSVNNKSLKKSWSEEETKFILDRYETYLSNVGPMKRFKTKKEMWSQITLDLKEQLHIQKDSAQIENRYKTVLRRKKKAVDNNQTSGASRMNVPYEEELNNIAAVDNSIEPELLRSARNVTVLKSRPVEQKQKKIKSKSMQEVFEEIHARKEEAKERRHREKIELLRELFNK